MTPSHVSLTHSMGETIWYPISTHLHRAGVVRAVQQRDLTLHDLQSVAPAQR